MAEAVGIALSVIPICMSAIEKYAEAARLLQRFRKYGDEALYISQAINIHKSIYRNVIHNLLSAALCEYDAREMLSDHAHALWSDIRIDRDISDRLGNSKDAFLDVVSAISVKLTKLESFGHEQKSQVSRTKEGDHSTSRTSKKGLRARIKLAFSRPEIESLITTISRLTQEMQTLVQQAEAVHKQHKVSQPSIATKTKIEQYNTVKQAARNLYQALSRACTIHSEHQAHLSLRPVHDTPSQIQFTIAMNRNSSGSTCVSTTNESKIWLNVESAVSNALQSADSPRILRELNHPNGQEANEGTTLRYKRSRNKTLHPSCQVEMRDNGQLALSGVGSLQPVLSQDDSESLPNFCANENFCTQLHKFSQQLQNNKSNCIGYLELHGDSKHLVYLKAATQLSTSSTFTPMTTLTDLFKPEYQINLPCHGLLPHDRIRIAKHLATAALQFQATPWLDKSWKSKEVSVLGPCDDDATAGSKAKATDHGDDLYLNVAIHQSSEEAAQLVQLPNRTLIRNRLLFDLGVMMLELAFQQSLIELRRPQDIDQHQEVNADYLTADRIRHQASARLGPRYAEAARKCIQCDFGHGSDLNETTLQESFYQNVICELEALEQIFGKLKLST